MTHPTSTPPVNSLTWESNNSSTPDRSADHGPPVTSMAGVACGGMHGVQRRGHRGGRGLVDDVDRDRGWKRDRQIDAGPAPASAPLIRYRPHPSNLAAARSRMAVMARCR